MCDGYPTRYFFGEHLHIWLAQYSLRRRNFQGVIKYAKPVAHIDCGCYSQPKLKSCDVGHCVARHFLIWTSGHFTSRQYRQAQCTMVLQLLFSHSKVPSFMKFPRYVLATRNEYTTKVAIPAGLTLQRCSSAECSFKERSQFGRYQHVISTHLWPIIVRLTKICVSSAQKAPLTLQSSQTSQFPLEQCRQW
jgi:hypothetical protein